MLDPEISIVIPLRDEEENVVPLHDELADVLDQIGVPYEVILVDDGSIGRHASTSWRESRRATRR